MGPWILPMLAAAAKSLQSCLTLCDPIDGSPPGSPMPGILQARTLEWVAISFSNAWKWKVKVKSLSCVRLFTTPLTIAHQAPPSMGFSRQEYWSGLPFPSPMCESEKWKWSRSVVSDSSRPHGLDRSLTYSDPKILQSELPGAHIGQCFTSVSVFMSAWNWKCRRKRKLSNFFLVETL